MVTPDPLRRKRRCEPQRLAHHRHARVCLDMLRSRKSRREDTIDEQPEPAAVREDGIDPEREAIRADSVGSALVIVLETLAPAERVAFVLHDMSTCRSTRSRPS